MFPLILAQIHPFRRLALFYRFYFAVQISVRCEVVTWQKQEHNRAVVYLLRDEAGCKTSLYGLFVGGLNRWKAPFLNTLLSLLFAALPTDEGPPLPCMKLRVTVCCEPSECSPLFICSSFHASPLYSERLVSLCLSHLYYQGCTAWCSHCCSSTPLPSYPPPPLPLCHHHYSIYYYYYYYYSLLLLNWLDALIHQFYQWNLKW